MSKAGPILSLIGGIISLLVSFFFRYMMYMWILSTSNISIAIGIISLLIYLFSFVSIAGGILGIKENGTAPTICTIAGVVLIICIPLELSIWMIRLNIFETNNSEEIMYWLIFPIIRAIFGIPPSILVLVGGIVGKRAIQIEEKDSKYIY